MAPGWFNSTADQSQRPSGRLHAGSVNRGADEFDRQRQAPAGHRQHECDHDLSQQAVFDDLVMDEVAEGVPCHDALGHLDDGEQHELAGSQPRPDPGGHIPPPRIATSHAPQATGQHPDDAAHRKDGADENRRRPPHVPGIGKNRRTADRVRNGQKICQDVTAQHPSRYEERHNSQPKQPPVRHSLHISPNRRHWHDHRTAPRALRARFTGRENAPSSVDGPWRLSANSR